MNHIVLSKHTTSEIYTEMTRILRQGGVVIAPSDSVYGLLVDSTNTEAVHKLIQVKNRPTGKPISVFTSGWDMMENLAVIQEKDRSVLTQILPGPFTIVLPSRHTVAPALESETGTIGLRYPDYPFITSFVHQYGNAVTATSANVSGTSPHYAIPSLLKSLPEYKKKYIDLILDAGTLLRNKPSTVLDLSGDTIQTIRSGDIRVKDSYIYETTSAEQTHKTAQHILHRIYAQRDKTKPLLFILKGDLGVGKTVFAKGLGQALGIDNIISPTYVITYEYPIPNNPEFRTFHHFDLYALQEQEELEHIGLWQALKKDSLLCIEWGERLGEHFQTMTTTAHTVLIEIMPRDETIREIKISLL